MQRLCLSLFVALACLLVLSKAQLKDAFERDQLIVYRIGDATYPASPTGTTTVPIYFDYYDRASGAKKGSYAVRTSDASADYYKCTHSQSAAFSGHLGLSIDKSQIGFGCFRADVGTTSPENSDSTIINRVVSFLGANGFIDTGTPIGYMEGDAGVGKGYITSVIAPLTGLYGPVSCLTSFYGNTLKPYYAVRMIDRYFGIFNWKQTTSYSGDNARALAMTDPDTPGSVVAYTTPGVARAFIQANTRFNSAGDTYYAAGSISNDPNGIAAISYGSNSFYYMTDASAPQRIYKAYKKNAIGYSSFYLNNDGGEYFGITARLVNNQVVYIYVTYRPAGASYSEVWEFQDAAGEADFNPTKKKLFTSASGQLFKGIAFSPVNTKCRDGAQDNQYDAGIDCGGPVCLNKCGSGSPCFGDGDCDSNRCSNGFCAAPTCGDNVLNQGEIDIDCGGPNCPKCLGGKSCYSDDDCDSRVCSNGKCTTASCYDGVMNSDEIGPDCGGVSCAIANKAKCPNGVTCSSDTTCASTYCDLTANVCRDPKCDDGVKNGLETDVDCGPYDSTCPRCDTGKVCDSFDDCDSWMCVGGTCALANCHDGQDNGFEPPSGDCGEWCYKNEQGGKLCKSGDRCFTAFDCDNVACGDIDYYPGNLYRGKPVGTCAQPSCTDGFKNGFETDTDCGGPVCTKKCPLTKKCTQHSDCEDLYCNNGVCDTPRCDDGIKNGLETDVDCGGELCSQALNITCAIGKGCFYGIDCDFANKVYCINKVCNTLPAPVAPVAAPQAPNTPSTVPFSAPPLPGVCATCTAPTPFCDTVVPACVGFRIIPIVQCVEEVAGTYYAFFSYESIANSDVTLTSLINKVNLDVVGGSLPMVFKPGRQDIFPKSTFVGSSVNPLPAEWYVDGIMMFFDLNQAELACPKDLAFQLLSDADVATLTNNLPALLDKLSTLLGISSAQLNITISALVKRAGGSVINVEVTSASASSIYQFVNQGGIDQLNTDLPVLSLTGVDSKPLPTEITGDKTPAVAPQSGSTPDGTTPDSSSPSSSAPGSAPTGGNQPISKTVSGAQQVAVCGALTVAMLALM